MAYTKTPTGDTYQNKKVPFKETWETRDRTNDKDVYSQNVVWEEIKNSDGSSYYEVMKRDGSEVFSTIDAGGVGHFVISMFWWESQNHLVVITDIGVYKFLPDGTNLGAIPGITTPIFRGGFTEFLYDAGNSDLIIATDVGWYVYNGTTATQITDPDFPAVGTSLAYPVFLDGFLFVASGANIYNSNLNNPLAWTASDFISSESYPDNLTGLARSGQYIVGLGSTSIQYFYDAANPTGTPLAAQTTVHRVGFVANLVEYQSDLYFIGQPANGHPRLCRLSGLELEVIDSPPFNREIVNKTFAFGGLYLFNEYPHFVTSYKPVGAVTRTPIAFNMGTKVWTRHVFQADSSDPNAPRMSISASIVDNTLINRFTVFSVSSRLDTSTITLYKVNPTVHQDAGVNYTCRVRTRNLDYDTRRNKFGSRLLLNCDQTTSPSLMSVSWTVDDYQTYVTPRTVDVGNIYPNVPALGVFKKIAFLFEYADNFPMRWSESEIDLNLGSI